MESWRRQHQERKNFQRNAWITLGLLFVAFLAKMEAINFLLAIPVGVWVTFHGYRLGGQAHQWASEKIDQSLSPFLILLLNLLLDITSLRIYVIIPALVGITAGYAVYSLLNVLFISP